MSGFIGTGGIDNGPQASMTIGASSLSSDLMYLLQAQDIEPGSEPSYQLCKTIYVAHPMGKKMVDAPIDMAQSQEREINIPGAPEERLLDAYKRVWDSIGNGVGADALIAYAARVSRIYGVSALVMGVRGNDPSEPVDRTKLYELEGKLYFNILDPLNTAGSLTLDQDPNSPDFQKATVVRAGRQAYHPANTVVQMNEQPLFIEWSSPAFGFSGRSVYQRALFLLKSYVQTMITDDLVSYKAGVIVAKMKSPSSNTNNRMLQMFGFKRAQIKTATTTNVLGIGVDEAIESIDLKNIEGPFKLVRENIIKNLATAADMPARVLDQETLSGNSLADGSEDAKNIARWVERFRITLNALYAFFDDVVQRIAWSPMFYADLKRDGLVPRGMSYEAALTQWRNAFVAKWPNLLIEPDSERLAGEEMRFKSAVALYEVLAEKMDPENLANLTQWLSDEVNGRKDLFSAEMALDMDAMQKSFEKRAQQQEHMTGNLGEEEHQPAPFSRQA